MPKACQSSPPKWPQFYSLPLRDALDKLRTEFRDIEMINSPLQNLALFRDALGGTSVLITSGGVRTPTTP